MTFFCIVVVCFPVTATIVSLLPSVNLKPMQTVSILNLQMKERSEERSFLFGITAPAQIGKQGKPVQVY